MRAGVLVCAVLLALEVSSAWWSVGWFRSDGRWWGIGGGGLVVGKVDREMLPEWRVGIGLQSFGWWFSGHDYPGDYRLAIPFWPFLFVAGIPTTVVWRRDLRSRRRARTGHCPKCGYDRRGIAAPSPCPECGAAAGGVNGR